MKRWQKAGHSILLCTLAAFSMASCDSRKTQPSAAGEKLPKAVTWAANGFKQTHVEGGVARFEVSARRAQLIARRFGPFRIAPLKEIHADDLKVVIWSEPSPQDSSSTTTKELTASLAAIIGGGQASGLVANGFRLQVLDRNSRELCALSADRARWRGWPSGKASHIVLEGSAAVRIDGKEIGSNHMEIDARDWSVRLERARGVRGEAPDAQPLRLRCRKVIS